MLANSKAPHHSASETRLGVHIFNLRFRAEALEVRDALQSAVDRFARQLSIDEAGTLELVLAEIMNNIVEHSYRGRDRGTIDLSIVRDQRGLSCSVSDDGIALPEDHLLRDIAALPRPRPLDLPEGGFGWFLIRDLAEDLGYRREGEQNLLAFRLPIGAVN
jgi:serine/threonine-protein kinase RsbW